MDWIKQIIECKKENWVYTSGSKNRNKGERAEFRYTGRKKGRYHSVPD